MASKVLLVDDELSVAKVVKAAVTGAGYGFSHAEDGLACLAMVAESKPDLIIMDVMMPKLDGFSTCRKLRAMGCTAPVIFLSAKGDIVDKGIGFSVGGDDYMTKPFDPRELLMHIEAHLRRAQASAQAAPKADVIHVGRFALDTRKHRVTKSGEEVVLTPKEFALLQTLAAHPGDVFSKEQLVEAAWGKEFVGETNSITVFMKKLRAKIEDDPTEPRIIETVWGIGYRLNPEACEE